ncbi:MAG: sugar phosphate isomerase/epimerase [Planctomycetes bacterium]|nr:sugar phosphate isomerase/epimerase [Planctomycetota bacterium]
MLHVLKFAYHTSGCLQHRLEDALRMIADAGYAGASITLDTHHLNPLTSGVLDVRAIELVVEELGLEIAMETGARFLLDSKRKHFPTLVTKGDAWLSRLEYLKRTIDVAERLGAGCVSLWSGVKEPGTSDDEAFEMLAKRLPAIIEYAGNRGIDVSFEPEPGMFIETVSEWHRLKDALADRGRLWLTLDVGHAHLDESKTIPDAIRENIADLRQIHIEDMVRPVHEHLPLGEGEIDFPSVLKTLEDLGYGNLISVELSRNTHDAPTRITESIDKLRGWLR